MRNLQGSIFKDKTNSWDLNFLAFHQQHPRLQLLKREIHAAAFAPGVLLAPPFLVRLAGGRAQLVLCYTVVLHGHEQD